MSAGVPAEPVRELIAWLLWCIDQGYTDPDDRAILHNWMGDDPATLHPDDVIRREHLMAMADGILEAALPAIVLAERERIRSAVNSDGFQATIRAYVHEGSVADDVSDAVLDLLDGAS